MDDIFENLAAAASHSARRGHADIAEEIETVMETLRKRGPFYNVHDLVLAITMDDSYRSRNTNMLVTVLTLEHKYGVDVSVHKTTEGAEKYLLEYLKDNWPDNKDAKPRPEDLRDAVRYYFETWHEWEESYNITSVRLLD